ncbi:MAG: DUF4337 domain-containing protein [Candidatus Acidiferrales bacterium]
MPDELQELQEHAEEGAHHASLAPVTVTMAILAVLVAAVSLMGHRTHTEELLSQTKATDQWAYYQSKDIRRRSYEVLLDELGVFALQSPAQAEQIKSKYEKEVERYKNEQAEIQIEAQKLEDEVKMLERRADRFDLGEVLLEAALVICSITLLTRKRIFWVLGTLAALAGAAIAATGFLIHIH